MDTTDTKDSETRGADTAPFNAIVLVRHGELDPNPEHRFVGQRDVALSPLGERHMEEVGQELAALFEKTPPKAFFCSDLARGVASADILRRAFRPHAGTMPVIADRGFREISLGAWEGLTKAEVEKRYPGALAERGADFAGYAPLGGESFSMLQRRALLALVRARHHEPEGLLVVVGHSAFNRCVLADYLALPLEDAVKLPQAYACWTLLENR